MNYTKPVAAEITTLQPPRVVHHAEVNKDSNVEYNIILFKNTYFKLGVFNKIILIYKELNF